MKATLITLFVVCLKISLHGQDMNVLNNIQNKVRNRAPTDSLRLILGQLEQLETKTGNGYVRYWKAYACYLIARQSFKKGDDTEQLLEKGIETLDKIPTKNSDQYALLSLLRGLNLNFVSKLTLPFKAKGVEKDAEKAIALDSTNCRAYLALGIYDLYVPKTFGGRQICEAMFKKAMALPEISDPNPYAPNWGNQRALGELVGYYVDEKKNNQAMTYIKEGLEKYPDYKYLKNMYTQLTK